MSDGVTDGFAGQSQGSVDGSGLSWESEQQPIVGSQQGADYSGFTWQQIVAAITGSDPNSAATADPATLQEAAEALAFTQQVMQEAGQDIYQQAVDLAGGLNCPWRGAAAQQLCTMMQKLGDQVTELADTMAGDDGIVQLLDDDATSLRWAINMVGDIEEHYARQVSAAQPTVNVNGVVQTSGSATAVDDLTDDMRQVLTVLQGKYLATLDSGAQGNSTGWAPNDAQGASPVESSPKSVGVLSTSGPVITGPHAGPYDAQGGSQVESSPRLVGVSSQSGPDITGPHAGPYDAQGGSPVESSPRLVGASPVESSPRLVGASPVESSPKSVGVSSTSDLSPKSVGVLSTSGPDITGPHAGPYNAQGASPVESSPKSVGVLSTSGPVITGPHAGPYDAQGGSPVEASPRLVGVSSQSGPDITGPHAGPYDAQTAQRTQDEVLPGF